MSPTPRRVRFGNNISEKKDRSRIRRSHDPGKFGALKFPIERIFLLTIVSHNDCYMGAENIENSFNGWCKLSVRGW